MAKNKRQAAEQARQRKAFMSEMAGKPKPDATPPIIPPEAEDFDFGLIEGKEFDTTLKEIAFKLNGETGWKLREMHGLLRDEYHKDLFENYMIREGDKYITNNKPGLHAILLQRTLVKPNGKFVTFDEAASLPSQLQTMLYLASRKLSALDRKKAKEAAAKNS